MPYYSIEHVAWPSYPPLGKAVRTLTPKLQEVKWCGGLWLLLLCASLCLSSPNAIRVKILSIFMKRMFYSRNGAMRFIPGRNRLDQKSRMARVIYLLSCSLLFLSSGTTRIQAVPMVLTLTAMEFRTVYDVQDDAGNPYPRPQWTTSVNYPLTHPMGMNLNAFVGCTISPQCLWHGLD